MADPDQPDSESTQSHGFRAPARMVLMADRGEGSEALSEALRNAGHAVLTCDVIAVPERAARLDPVAVVVNIEQPNALPSVGRLIDALAQHDAQVAIVAIGTVEMARRIDLASAEHARLFSRPLPTEEIVAFVSTMASRSPSRPVLADGADAPSSSGAGTSVGSTAGQDSETGVGRESDTGVGPDSDSTPGTDSSAVPPGSVVPESGPRGASSHAPASSGAPGSSRTPGSSATPRSDADDVERRAGTDGRVAPDSHADRDSSVGSDSGRDSDSDSGTGLGTAAGTGIGTGVGTGIGTAAGSGTGIGGDSDALLDEFPSLGMPEVEGILPKLDGGPISTKEAGRLSPEIEALLETKARRVREQEQEHAQPAAEPHVLVPPEMLAIVDDLLSSEEPPATRGGMELAEMMAAQAAAVPPAAPSSQAGPFDSRPSWQTGVPEASSSDIGSVPTGLVSERTSLPFDRLSDERLRDEEAFGPPLAHHNPQRGTQPFDARFDARFGSEPSPPLPRDRPSEAPGTQIGLGEETSVPGGGTQVGHSSPLESGPAPAIHSSAPPGGSNPPLPTELRPQAASGAPFQTALRTPTGTELPPSMTPDDAGPRHGVAHHAGPHHARLDRAMPITPRPGTARHPVSSLTPSELAPMTTAGAPVFSSAHPQLRGAAPGAGPALFGQMQPEMPDNPDVQLDSRAGHHGDPFDMLATAVRRRETGALVLATADGAIVRRVLMRDGDMVNAASEHEGDALVHFLVRRGDLSPEVAHRSARLPHTGRHAAAALIANGYLGQDDLWPVLRSHAEWIMAQALLTAPAVGSLEREPPERLRAEPNVFGGAAGVEVFIEAVRRVLPAPRALERLGGPEAVLGEGPSMELLAESALSTAELDSVHGAIGQQIDRVLDPALDGFETVLFALTRLGILTARAPSRRPERTPGSGIDPLDADAVRQRVRARMALVHEADYFSLLGVSPAATSYEIRRAFVELRRLFEPARLLTAATSDLHDDLKVIVEVLEEAYQILRDPHRRSRYRRAIEAAQPRV